MARIQFDVEEEMSLPGGVGFIDTTNLLQKGVADLEIGTILSVDGFMLQDAMSALEIMDPRMDSGMADPPPPFDPHMPLLPSEVCWILDRSFACEMSWHTGLALSQTVYTLQYVHHLSDIAHRCFNTGLTTRSTLTSKDPERPMELVTLVLRAGVFGLLKCCDLVWRELANDHLVDGEDWNGEKFGVSLCEGVQSDAVISLLEEAINWLQGSSSVSSSPWRAPLLQRIGLRKNVLQTLAYPSLPALRPAKQDLEAILTGTASPQPSIVVQNAFDPAIARRLVSFVPTRIVEMPSQTEVWEAISMWLDGWEGVRGLIGAEDLRSLKMLADLRAYEGQSPRRSAFLRSLSISTFFNGQKIVLSHDPPWLVDRFFCEIAAVDAMILSRLEDQLSENGSAAPTPSSVYQENIKGKQRQAPPKLKLRPEDGGKITELFEKGLAKLLVDLFSSSFHNRARQRRRFAASLLDWHLAFDQASIIAARLSSSSSQNLALSRVPLCIRHVRLSVITDIVFSGFELELYTPHEWAMMYWYAGRLLVTQVAVLEELRSSILRDSGLPDTQEALGYLSFQLEYAGALRCLSIAMRDVMCRYAPAKAKINDLRERANFERRFKWAFITGYAEAAAPDEDKPVLENWREWRAKRELGDDTLSDAASNLASAQHALSRLSEYEPTQSGAVLCPEAYKGFMVGLARACDANVTFLKTSPDTSRTTCRDWHWKSSRWFPENDSPHLSS